MNLCTCPVLVQRHGEMVVLTPCAFVSVAELEQEGRRTAAARRMAAYRAAHPEWAAMDRERARRRMAAKRGAA